MATLAASIPLHCNICPRKPNFSDVSHLLTHIASKGHLSHYYKVKVRSGQEEASKRIIEAYDRWYEEWQVEDLMSERMSCKDKRRPRARLTSNSTRSRQQSNAPSDHLRRRAVNALDPRLTAQMVKNEPSPTPAPSMMSYGSGSPTPRQSFPPRMQAYPNPFAFNTGYADTPAISEDSEYIDRPTTPVNTVPAARHSLPPSLLSTAGGDAHHDETTVSECSKLKGVYWPGMDIFDSATPEMKRKRNQKKDISVLEQLQTNSQEVEATEFVFTPLGSLKKQRPISGSVTSSSPMKLESSPRSVYLSRSALEDMDVNNPRRRKRKPARALFMDDGPAAYEDDDLDLQLAIGKRRKTSNFNIFKDDEVSFGRPAGLNLLNSDFHPQQVTDTNSNSEFDFRAFEDPFQSTFNNNTTDNNSLGFDAFQQPPMFFPNAFSFTTNQPLQPPPALQEAPNFFNDSFLPDNSTWPTLDKPADADNDDQRTVTAPPSQRGSPPPAI
ncbi:hypothetical protein K490DRAFT_62143 [Saccharata proteae CBS 121410]|uniref:Uncharacterized protein n=1 Tax=Saccharata proteae CBS 121410 TaxID=1314787 RepID=A0A9P4HX22_9PEZI|nr:hypothetical protein K490DRAFT_62143 [Saccharata proteae CBS 121410]